MLFLQLLVYYKDIVKDTDEERRRVRPGSALGAGASIPMELGCATSWHVDVFTNLEDFQTPYFMDFCGSFIM